MALDWEGHDEIYQLLASGVFHVTSGHGFLGILKEGAILPNKGEMHYTHPQSKHNWGVKQGGVCLFDFPSATAQQIEESFLQWSSCATPVCRATNVFLGVRTERLPKFVSNQAAKTQLSCGAFFLPYVEAWNLGPIPLSAVVGLAVAVEEAEVWRVIELPASMNGRDTAVHFVHLQADRELRHRIKRARPWEALFRSNPSN